MNIQHVLLVLLLIMNIWIFRATINLYGRQTIIRRELFNILKMAYEIDRRIEDNHSVIFDKLDYLELDLVSSKSLTPSEVSQSKSEIFREGLEERDERNERRRAEDQWLEIMRKDLVR